MLVVSTESPNQNIMSRYCETHNVCDIISSRGYIKTKQYPSSLIWQLIYFFWNEKSGLHNQKTAPNQPSK